MSTTLRILHLTQDSIICAILYATANKQLRPILLVYMIIVPSQIFITEDYTSKQMEFKSRGRQGNNAK